MNSFSMESVFLILSGVIFMAGILYWFWSHIQLTQKKVLLLESAVFELRSQLTRLPEQTGPPVYADLADDWEDDKPVEVETQSNSNLQVEASSSVNAAIEMVDASNIPEDLRPGGNIPTQDESAIKQSEDSNESNTQFRELFINENASTVMSSSLKTPESLDSMSLKELRRLAEQRGVPNPNDLRKKEILSALRQQITPPSSSSNEEKVVQLQEVEEVAVTEIVE